MGVISHKRPWMANLAVSLLLLCLVSSALPLKPAKRDTNPPFPVSSEEADSRTDDDLVTTTLIPEHDVANTKPRHPIKSVFMNAFLRKKNSGAQNRNSSTSSNITLRDQEVHHDQESAEARTYSSLLTPLPTTPQSSSFHVNKTARSSNANLSLSRRNHNQNQNNVAVLTNQVRIPSENNGSNNVSSIRGARPTSSVILNPSSYNRVVKRKRVTSLNGRNRDGDDVPQTTVGDIEIESATNADDEVEGTTITLRSSPSAHQNGSRAIAGFSKKGPVRVVSRTGKPKPIIIRDHESYFRNLTTESATGSSASDLEGNTEHPTETPISSNNVLESQSNVKVRKVKVGVKRPINENNQVEMSGSNSNDHGTRSVVTSSSTTTTESPRMATPDSHHDVSSNLNPHEIQPTPASPSPDDGFTTRRVYKEEFGIVMDSYDHPHHHDQEEQDEEDSFASTLEDGEDEHSSDMEVEATTEHYASLHPSKGNVRFSNFRIQPSGPSEESGGNPDAPRIALVRDSGQATSKYRDYYTEIPTGGHVDGHNTDGLNHLYSKENSVAPSRTTTPSYNASNIEFQIPAPIEHNSHPVHNASDSSHGASIGPTISTEKFPHHPPITNSVEEVHAAQENITGIELSPTPTTLAPRVSSKAVTSAFFTKVEQPHFTSSSYEFSTTQEYSYSSHHDQDHDDHDHGHFNMTHEHPHENVSHVPDTAGTEFQSHIVNLNGTSTIATPVLTSASTTPIAATTSTRPSTTTTTTTKATSSTTTTTETPAVVPKNSTTVKSTLKPSTPESNSSSSSVEHDSLPTESGYPEISHSNVSEQDESQEKNESSGGSVEDDGVDLIIKHFPTVHVPAIYQVPVLVKMEVHFPHGQFCSYLEKLKEMISRVYGKGKRGLVAANQIVVYTQHNCTSHQADIIPSDASTPSHFSTEAPALVTSVPSKNTSTTSQHSTAKPVTDAVKHEDKNATTTATTHSATSTTLKPGNKSVLKRRRRSANKTGESLILDNKNGFESSATDGRSSSGSASNLPQQDGIKPGPASDGIDEVVLVYFYVNDREGKYDQKLTMAFYEYWNLSQAIDGKNGSEFQGVFYQRVKKVDMVSTSQLVASEDDANENSGIIAAIAIASIAAACLFLIGVLLLVLRHRQSQTKFAKRCTPVSLEGDFSMDNISFTNSFRRKQRLRGSKRSYTNAAFDDHTAPSRVVNGSTLQTALSDGSAIDAEFRAIPNVNPTLDDIPQGAESKNRYANVIPMPDTRVLLTFQEDQPNSDYINANFIRGANGEQKKYIITQGPLEETVVDFWRMIWEQQVRVIFMMTDFVELGHSKCAEYYPRSETIDCSQLHGDFQVTLEKKDITDNCITSYLLIKDMERNLRRDVIHLWYHSWPDKGVPSTAKPTVDFLLKSRKFTKEATPVVVHCSPGTGRSGTIVACDIAMREFELNQKVDIPRMVLRLRQDRAGCIQTKEQYLHVYEALHYFATRYPSSQMESIIGAVP